MNRCYYKKNENFKYYGGRGIKVCDRWHEFENFLRDMGERPDNTTIDRINSNGHYEPGNCRWATSKQQTETKRPKNDDGNVNQISNNPYDFVSLQKIWR